MKTLDIWITGKEIQQRVENETAIIARGQKDDKGNSLFSSFVFDEDQYSLFRVYFKEAAEKAIDKCSAYIRNMPVRLGEDDEDARHLDEDFYAILEMPREFSNVEAAGVNQAIYQHLIAFVVYRWLESKIPNLSTVYFNRSEQNLQDLSSRLERRVRPFRRSCRWM